MNAKKHIELKAWLLGSGLFDKHLLYIIYIIYCIHMWLYVYYIIYSVCRAAVLVISGWYKRWIRYNPWSCEAYIIVEWINKCFGREEKGCLGRWLDI